LKPAAKTVDLPQPPKGPASPVAWAVGTSWKEALGRLTDPSSFTATQPSPPLEPSPPSARIAPHRPRSRSIAADALLQLHVHQSASAPLSPISPEDDARLAVLQLREKALRDLRMGTRRFSPRDLAHLNRRFRPRSFSAPPRGVPIDDATPNEGQGWDVLFAAMHSSTCSSTEESSATRDGSGFPTVRATPKQKQLTGCSTCSSTEESSATPDGSGLPTVRAIPKQKQLTGWGHGNAGCLQLSSVSSEAMRVAATWDYGQAASTRATRLSENAM